MKTLKAGTRLRSAVCATEVMVIRAPAGELDLRCGGVAMLTAGESAPATATLDPAQAQGSLVGKRYVDAAEAIEILCTKGGAGALSLAGTLLEIKIAKALPSSD